MSSAAWLSYWRSPQVSVESWWCNCGVHPFKGGSLWISAYPDSTWWQATSDQTKSMPSQALGSFNRFILCWISFFIMQVNTSNQWWGNERQAFPRWTVPYSIEAIFLEFKKALVWHGSCWVWRDNFAMMSIWQRRRRGENSSSSDTRHMMKMMSHHQVYNVLSSKRKNGF